METYEPNGRRPIPDHSAYIKPIFEYCPIAILDYRSEWINIIAGRSAGGGIQEKQYNIDLISSKNAKEKKKFWYWELNSFLGFLADVQEDLDNQNRGVAEIMWDFLIDFRDQHPLPIQSDEVENQFLEITDLSEESDTQFNQAPTAYEQLMRLSSSSSEESSSINEFFCDESNNIDFENSKYCWVVRFQMFHATEKDLSSYIYVDGVAKTYPIVKIDNLYSVVHHFLPYEKIIDLRKIIVTSMLEIVFSDRESTSTADSWYESENTDRWFWERGKIAALFHMLIDMDVIKIIGDGKVFKIENFREFKMIASTSM